MAFKHTLTAFTAAAAMLLPLGAQDGAATAPAPEIKPTGKAPSEAIQGYWAPNLEAMLAVMMEQMPAEATADDAAVAAMKPMLESMVAKLAFHFGEGESEMITPAGIETAKWNVVSEDAKTGELKVTITNSDGSTEDGEAIVGKDTMLMINTKEGMKIQCDRITEAEFKKRKAAASGAAE